MAKKDFKGGFDKLLSGGKTQQEIVVEPQEQIEAPVARRGRPKKWEGSKSSEGDIRTSLIVNETKYKKLEAIAQKEGLTKKELIDTALDIIIDGYEKKNGVIEPQEKEERDLKSLFL